MKAATTSRAILARQIEMTYRQFPMLATASMVISVLFVYVVGREVPGILAGGWFALAVAIMALRVRFFREFSASPMDLDKVSRRRFHLLLGAVASGLLWCLATLSYFMVDDGADRIFVVVAIVGTTMIGALWHAAIPWASLSYMLPAMLAFGFIMLCGDSDATLIVVTASVLVLFTLWVVLLRSGRMISEWSVQTQRNTELANGLETAYANLLEEMFQRERADEHTATFGRKLELVMRGTPLPTIEWDQNYRVTEWNPAAEALFGYSRAEVVGRMSVADLIFPEQWRGQARELLQQLIARREGFHVVSENVSREGQALTCSWAVTPLIDSNDCLIGIVAQAMDMTAQNSAFKVQEESQRRLEEAQQLAHIGHWQWDCADGQASFSREALRIFAKPAAWNPTLTEIAELVTDGAGMGLMERVRQVGAEQIRDFCIEHRLGDAGGLRELRTSVRVECAANGAVLRFIAATQDVTEMRNYQQQLHSLAFFDTLTGLPNRALFCDRMRQSIAEASWHKDLMGLMVLDLDNFKEINDALGHNFGDQLLREAARRLSGCVRAYDTVARLGGDEFAILLPEVRDGADLGNIARKIIEAFALPFRLDGMDAEKDFFVTSSIGIVLYPSDSHDADELLRYADLAMYHAKKQGRNNFQFYSAELTERSSERLALDAHLRQAEKNGELEVYYQPQIDLASGRLIGAEALLRWHHPQRGLVMPDKFIGIAEDTGLIVSIGEWVLRSSCRTARLWNEGRTDGLVRVAVNLSPRQFRQNDLVGTLRRALAETGCRPEWLECEITESLLLDDCDNIRAMLVAIDDMGISLAIDDFGTGYSSLGYLNRYPVGSIKIDRSFVRDIMTDHNAAELVKAIISMAHSLRLKLVAEGVETAEQEAFLKNHRCHIGQGWLYGKAMLQAKFELLLQHGRYPAHC